MLTQALVIMYLVRNVILTLCDELNNKIAKTKPQERLNLFGSNLMLHSNRSKLNGMLILYMVPITLLSKILKMKRRKNEEEKK